MNTKLRTYTIASLAVLILTVGVRSAPAQPPKIEFVQGEPYRENLPKTIRKFAKVITVFETMPTSDKRGVSGLYGRAMDKSMEEFRIPTGVYELLNNSTLKRSLIRHRAVQESTDEPARDRWTIVGVDDAMIKVLTENILTALEIAENTRVEQARQSLAKASKGLPESEDKAAEAKAKYDRAVQQATDEGVIDMTRKSIAAVANDLRLGLTTTRIDVAELLARLQAARTQQREFQDNPPLLVTLIEIQSNLEIDLAGKLARQKAMEEELSRLAKADKYKTIIKNLNHHQLAADVDRRKKNIEKLERKLAELESGGSFRVVGGNIVISPIAEPVAGSGP